MTAQMVETKIMDSLDSVHYALTSRQNEINYLRQLADHLINCFIDENRLAGHSNDHDSPLQSTAQAVCYSVALVVFVCLFYIFMEQFCFLVLSCKLFETCALDGCRAKSTEE